MKESKPSLSKKKETLNSGYQEHFRFLDGLRGFAVLTVVYSHTINSGGFGANYMQYNLIAETGVWLFFVLSSFLLTRGLYLKLKKTQENNNYLKNTFVEYIIRRVLRVYPMYLLIWLFTWLFPAWTPPCFGLNSHFVSWKSLFLIKSFSIMWTIPVEMQAYLVIPVIPLVIFFAKESWAKWMFRIILVTIAYCFLTPFSSPRGYPLSGLYETLPVFLVGSIAAILFVKLEEALQLDFVAAIRKGQPQIFSIASIIGDLCCWIIFLVLIWFSTNAFNALFGNPHTIPNNPRLQGPLCSALLTLGLLSQRTFVSFFEWSFLVYCGKISYSLYLTHLWGIWYHGHRIRWFGDPGLLSVFILTIAHASLMHYLVEKRIFTLSTFLVESYRKYEYSKRCILPNKNCDSSKLQIEKPHHLVEVLQTECQN